MPVAAPSRMPYDGILRSCCHERVEVLVNIPWRIDWLVTSRWNTSQ